MLKFLDLYGNQITQKGLFFPLTFRNLQYFLLLGVEALAELLNQSGPLEYLGLAKNLLSTADDLASFFKVIGRFPMTKEEAEAHQKKEKDRDAIILKNQKVNSHAVGSEI